ncbi:hypothetical protein DSUL_160076 [Desulfovibrionales bacterium]
MSSPAFRLLRLLIFRPRRRYFPYRSLFHGHMPHIHIVTVTLKPTSIINSYAIIKQKNSYSMEH